MIIIFCVSYHCYTCKQCITFFCSSVFHIPLHSVRELFLLFFSLFISIFIFVFISFFFLYLHLFFFSFFSFFSQHGYTPLMHAALYGTIDTVKLLLCMGADIHATTAVRKNRNDVMWYDVKWCDVIWLNILCCEMTWYGTKSNNVHAMWLVWLSYAWVRLLKFTFLPTQFHFASLVLKCSWFSSWHNMLSAPNRLLFKNSQYYEWEFELYYSIVTFNFISHHCQSTYINSLRTESVRTIVHLYFN